jgi:hydroxypyruvate reductase
VQTTLGVEGEARDVGTRLAGQALHLRQRSPSKPQCIILGGETTVTVRGNGKGGRNQELALAAAIEIAGQGDIVIASFSTDGVDGPTNAAGAVATHSSVRDAAARGIDVAAALARNDSHRFFDAAGGLIRTGPTGTNVNDVAVALIYPAAHAR